MKRKTISIILSITLLITMMPMQGVFAASKSKTKATVSTQKELNKAFKNKKLETLTIKTGKKKSFTISKSVKNPVNVAMKTSNATLNLEKRANVNQVSCVKKNSKLRLNLKVDVNKLKISAKSTVNINNKGKDINPIKINITDKAKGSAVTTNAKVDVTTKSNVKLVLSEGAEGSTVKIAKDGKKVDIVNNTYSYIAVENPDGSKSYTSPGHYWRYNNDDDDEEEEEEDVDEEDDLSLENDPNLHIPFSITASGNASLMIQISNSEMYDEFYPDASADQMFEYKIGNGSWQPVKTGNNFVTCEIIGLSNGQKMQIRATNWYKNERLATNEPAVVQLMNVSNMPLDNLPGMTVPYSGAKSDLIFSGNIMSLCDPAMEVDTLLEGEFKGLCQAMDEEFCSYDTYGAPVLPAKHLAKGCYKEMFKKSSLTVAPKLPATVLAQECYSGMFNGCKNLNKAYKLSADALPASCYANMFYGCSSLVKAPKIMASTVSDYSCEQMFGRCYSLKIGPELFAETLAIGCYCEMFKSCTKLESLTIHFVEDTAEATSGMLGGDPNDAGSEAENGPILYVPASFVGGQYFNLPACWTTSPIPVPEP